MSNRTTFQLAACLLSDFTTASSEAKIYNGFIVSPNGQDFYITQRPGYLQLPQFEDFGNTIAGVYRTSSNTLPDLFSAGASNQHYFIVDADGDIYSTANSTAETPITNLANLYLTNGVTFAESETHVYIHGGTGGVTGKSDYLINKYPTGFPGLVWTVTEITDADHPVQLDDYSPPGAVWLDGYFFVGYSDGAGTSRIYNSNLNAYTAWSSVDFIATQLEGDDLRYLARHKNHVVAFGDRSIEFFYNAGNPSGSPLARRPDIIHEIGIFTNLYARTGVAPGTPSAYSSSRFSLVAELGDMLFFIGKDKAGLLAVYKLENFQLTKISSDVIDRLLNTNGTGYMKGIININSGLVVININSIAYVYDIKYNLWYEWSLTYAQGVHGDYFGNGTALCFVAQDSLDDSTDTAAGINVQIITPIIDGINEVPKSAGVRKFQNELQISGMGRPTSTFNIAVSYSDDSYRTFSAARNLDYSKVRNKLTRLGQFTERAYKLSLTTSSSVPKIAIKDLILDTTLGIS